MMIVGLKNKFLNYFKKRRLIKNIINNINHKLDKTNRNNINNIDLLLFELVGVSQYKNYIKLIGIETIIYYDNIINYDKHSIIIHFNMKNDLILEKKTIKYINYIPLLNMLKLIQIEELECLIFKYLI